MAGAKIEPTALTVACESATAEKVVNNGSTSELTVTTSAAVTTAVRLLRTASIRA